MLGLQYKIVYKQGADNGVADALSRRSSVDQILAMSSSTPLWLAAVVTSYASDPQATELITKLSLKPDSVPNYTLSGGVLRFKNRIWIGNDKALQSQLISAMHSSTLGGHSGIPVTYSKLKQYFFWPAMKSSIQQYIQACGICQQAKPDRARYPGLLQPLPVLDSAWQMVSLDFVEGLPRSGSYNSILVVVDKFSKFAHFIPLRHPFTALSVAKAYMDNVYKLHGLPLSLVSDRDRVFTSKLWQELFSLAGVQLRMSSSYHPQTDGQIERVNQCMETFLHCFVHACPTKWIQWLSLAEFWYNTSCHSALGRSPFEVLYGHSPRHFGLDSASAISVLDLSDWLHEREVMQGLVKQHLLRAQERMKRQADKGRSERCFNVGDSVFLKLQPYAQTSLAPRANQMLSFKFFGPFRVLERIGSVAYRLELPPSASIHPVFHVSQLKKAVGDQDVSPVLPDSSAYYQVPERVLQRRLSPGDRPVLQGLIKWSGMPSSLATWENMADLRRRFPRAATWGQVASQEEGSVGTVSRSSPRPMRDARPNVRVHGPEWQI